ncbi:hypothetical protein BGW36DRAFT_293526 [Talaromyces proteolyticus]|uniref:Uncharacterized protein n=1 Tax=Talaromyces proteolyticus TaxID=1131652 RepID=A0AAD4Q1L3_9EURO|nr:uncharacterized protein BGW36DRAFT_293526 [Talaromyces proteolyticus]KAH8698668.1 hypothetical protein BGW36DRAFT_293526 [Talaromyces proteolyticus]
MSLESNSFVRVPLADILECTISDALQRETKDTVDKQSAFIEADLKFLRNENVIQESDMNPEFQISLIAAEKTDRNTYQGY